MSRKLYDDTQNKIYTLYRDINDNAIVTLEQLQNEYTEKITSGEIDGTEQDFSGYVRNCKTENGGTLETVRYIVVNDVPVFGKFKVIKFFGKDVLHQFDDDGDGDIMPDVAMREVVAISAENDYTIIEVF